jgi:hypothetical protein
VEGVNQLDTLLHEPEVEQQHRPSRWTRFANRTKLLFLQFARILGAMVALLAFILVSLGVMGLAGRQLASQHDTGEESIEPRKANQFGPILLGRLEGYSAGDASPGQAGHLGPANLAINGKTLKVEADTPLYGAACPMLAQAEIPNPPPCYTQVGLENDGKTITFVTALALPDPDDGVAPLSYKGVVASSGNRQLVIADGTTFTWGNNPRFNTCADLTRGTLATHTVKLDIDRVNGRISGVTCEAPPP